MKPKKLKRGDPFSARRMNDIISESMGSRRTTGTGPSVTNDSMGNQIFSENFRDIRLVIAITDFAIPSSPTDFHTAVDSVPSGLCLMVRLNDVAEYVKETRNTPFRVYDPVSQLNGSSTKSLGESFYAVFNRDTKRWEVLSGVSAAGHEILFNVVNVYCPDGYGDPCDEFYAEVEYTWYSGGCSTPPGVDAYTGLIRVYDRGVFEYYTADQLVNGSHREACGQIGQGMAGRATYWYPRTDGGYEECTPRWMVDSIIGNPECNDSGVEDVGV